jgi:hypothetical protein
METKLTKMYGMKYSKSSTKMEVYSNKYRNTKGKILNKQPNKASQGPRKARMKFKINRRKRNNNDQSRNERDNTKEKDKINKSFARQTKGGKKAERIKNIITDTSETQKG